MTEEALRQRREYHRKWSRENPDKIRATHERYWEKKAAAARAAASRDAAAARDAAQAAEG